MKLPLLTPRDMAKILAKLGFSCRSQSGSHQFWENRDGRTTLIPNHPGEMIDRGLLNKIVKHDLRMEREEFLRYC